MVNPRKKPKFVRWGSTSLGKLKSAWRKPHGIHSKIREKRKGKLKMPSVSYGAPRELKFLHPSGFNEIIVNNLKDLEKVNAEKDVARVASTVGKKKRTDILKKAEELKIKVLNPRI